jgi:site-specific recombinase XerD
MLRNGADVVSLSRMMGHGSLPVLMRYLRQEKQDLGRVHERHSPVDNWL